MLPNSNEERTETIDAADETFVLFINKNTFKLSNFFIDLIFFFLFFLLVFDEDDMIIFGENHKKKYPATKECLISKIVT